MFNDRLSDIDPVLVKMSFIADIITRNHSANILIVTL
jgi:hypothetical protein